ncbi:MAG: arginyltransferase, partial [Alphaproteobacteria bacterium]
LTPVPPRAGTLKAVALTDIMTDGLSMVYSFFADTDDRRSLGTFLILDHVRRAQAMGKAYVYLGYWVKESPKMAYKSRFRPLERLTADGWVEFAEDQGSRP